MGLARKDLAEGQTCGSKERLVFYLKGNWATASQEGSHPTGQPNVSCENISDSGAGSGVSEEQLCRRGRHPETSSIWVLPREPPQCWTSREWIPQLDALMDPADDDSSTRKQQRQKCIGLCGAMSRLTRVIIQDMTPLDLWSSGWMSSLSSLHLQNTSCVYLLQLGLQSAEQLRDSSNKMCKDRSSWIITKTESLK